MGSWDKVDAAGKTNYTMGCIWPSWVYVAPEDINAAPVYETLVNEPIATMCGLMMDGSVALYTNKTGWQWQVWPLNSCSCCHVVADVNAWKSAVWMETL